jgi:Fe-S-cluster containining protein
MSLNLTVLGRCSGHCCKRFFLPYNYEALQARAKEIPDDVEFQQVAGMVIPIEPDERGGNQYTCKNHLNNGDCGIYKDRPKMCSEYPSYGENKPCMYVGKGCTLESVDKQGCE